MTANTSPIFILTPNTPIGTSVTAANTAMDGTGTVQTIFTAGANGSYVKTIRVKAQGTNVQTVVRIFTNNGSTNTTATNNTLIKEATIAATTANNSAANPDYEIPMNMVLQASYKLLFTIGTAVSAGVIPAVEGGDY